jgi:hypothetical protein
VSERDERIPGMAALTRGEKGDKGSRGDKGDRGERGMPAAQRRAIVYLFVVGALVGAACLGGLAYFASRLESQQQAVVREQRELSAATAANNRERCTSLEQVAAIPVPHPVAGNPSREWEARFEAIQGARARQLDCPQ